MQILIVTDAWLPQINGVAVTLQNTVRELERMGHRVRLITPLAFRTVPMPTYPEIRLAVRPRREVSRMIEEFDPDAIHIATEGPLGLAARRHCLRRQRPFTTAYHTQFPEYVHARCRLPVGLTYAWLRWFHGPAKAVMCGTPADPASARRARLQEYRAVVSRSRYGTVQAGRANRRAGSPAGVSLRRARRGREEHRSLPVAGPARDPMGGR